MTVRVPDILGHTYLVEFGGIWLTIYLQGYLYSSSIDYLTTLQPGLSYTWLLMAIGWLLPNMLIIMSHATVIATYR